MTVLIIRQSQVDQFSFVARGQFVSRLQQMLEKHFPTRCATLPDGALSSLVEDTMQTGPRFGAESEREISYLCAMRLHFGWAFPTRPEDAWVHEQVSSPRAAGATSRMEVWWQRAASRLPE